MGDRNWTLGRGQKIAVDGLGQCEKAGTPGGVHSCKISSVRASEVGKPQRREKRESDLRIPAHGLGTRKN